ncbi:hypothetical protein KIL84_002435 [Mauremys mutica]|uniref:Uncharacterized protein n=1 Tax=Mauremys mutica TaxID=74926 RepID=A0A9D3X6T2_9SAUR|nr:hypothetical protein KIL84_002435 [Mauremys mutica]
MAPLAPKEPEGPKITVPSPRPCASTSSWPRLTAAPPPVPLLLSLSAPLSFRSDLSLPLPVSLLSHLSLPHIPLSRNPPCLYSPSHLYPCALSSAPICSICFDPKVSPPSPPATQC